MAVPLFAGVLYLYLKERKTPEAMEKCIREYGSTLYVGMALKKNGHPYISIASDELNSLVIYRNKF